MQWKTCQGKWVEIDKFNNLFGIACWCKYEIKEAVGLVVERFERRLISWERNYLSLCKKITLIKATFFELPDLLCHYLRCPQEWLAS